MTKGQFITGQYYANLLRELREKIKKNGPEKLSLGVLFHQDNAPAHKSSAALATIHEYDFQLVEHPPYSPDSAPSDNYLFPKMKKELSGQHFTTDNDVIDAVEIYLEDQDSSFCKERIRKLYDLRNKCVNLQGDYVEK